MGSSLQLYLDGRPMALIGGWGGLTFSTLADGGCGDCAWAMSLPDTFAHPALARNHLVQVKAGPKSLYAGILNEPTPPDDTNGWTFAASGLFNAGKGRLALDGAGTRSGVPNTVVDQAIATGLPWIRGGNISSTAVAVPSSSSQPMFVNDVLDLWALNVSRRWGVDGDQQIYTRPDPTIPSWVLAPGAGRVGFADEDYATHIFLRYLKADGTYATATASDTITAAQLGRVDYPADATSYGALDPTVATNMAAGLLAKGKARQAWTNQVTPSRWQLMTPGGVPATPWMVRGGQVVTMYGVLDEAGQPLPYFDFVIGEAAYSADDNVLTLSPVTLAARDLSTVLELASTT